MPPPDPTDLESNLHRIAGLLRDAQHLSPEAQQSLALLVDDLAGTVRKPTGDPLVASQVATTAAHLLDALAQKHDAGVLSAAKNRLERTVMSAEDQAPMAAGVAQRLLDILAGIGI